MVFCECTVLGDSSGQKLRVPVVSDEPQVDDEVRATLHDLASIHHPVMPG